MKRRQAIAAAMGPLLLGAASVYAQSNDGSQPVRIIIPFGPGSGLDLIGRALAPGLGEFLGSSVIVENREGAAGSIGARSVASANPNGKTLLLAASPPFAVLPFMQKDPAYRPVEDFSPIARIAANPMVLVASREAPIGTFPEMVAYARAHPGQLDYASAGIGVPSHLFMEQLKQALGLNLTFIPYKSTGQMYTDVLSGRVPLATVTLSVAKPHLESGAWRGLAIGEPTRHALFPDIPAISEVSPKIDISRSMKVWYGLLGPARLPASVLDSLYRGVEGVAQQPEFRKILSTQLVTPALQNSSEFAESLRTDVEQNARLITTLGLAGTT